MCCWGPAWGKTNEKVLPRPSLLLAQILPPCSATMCWEIARPKPPPSRLRESERVQLHEPVEDAIDLVLGNASALGDVEPHLTAIESCFDHHGRLFRR